VKATTVLIMGNAIKVWK